MSTTEELRTLLKARYKTIYAVTWEEERVVQSLLGIASEVLPEYTVYTWSIASGLANQSSTEQVPDLPSDPVAILSYIYNNPNKKAVYVLRDFHAFMKDATTVRFMRDIANQSGKTVVPRPIIITSPIMQIPVELEKQIQVLDFDLPGRKQLVEIITNLWNSVKSKKKGEKELTNEILEHLVSACQGLTVNEIEDTLAKSWAATQDFIVDYIISEKKQIIRKSGVLEYYDNLEEFANVGGMDVLKNWLSKRGNAFSEEAKEFGLPTPKGVLLLGIQGCGKTMICKSLAGLWKVPLLRLDVGKVMAGLVGSSEENMRKALRVAEAVSPSIIVIDEIEKAMAGVNSSGMTDGGTTSRVFGTFLTWMNDHTSPVFTIATSNNIRQLPPELLRKGRFDEIFWVALPSLEERKEIIGIHLAKKKRNVNDFDIEMLAKISEGFSGAEIEQNIIDGLHSAFDEDKRDLNTGDIEEAMRICVPLSKSLSEKIDELKQWARGKARCASSEGQKEMDAITSQKATASIASAPGKMSPSRFAD